MRCVVFEIQTSRDMILALPPSSGAQMSLRCIRFSGGSGWLKARRNDFEIYTSWLQRVVGHERSLECKIREESAARVIISFNFCGARADGAR